MGFYDGHLLPVAVSLTAHMRINGWQRIGIIASVIYAGVVYNRTRESTFNGCETKDEVLWEKPSG
jgi:hypothetical protein